ncbi:putative p22 protein precursor [Trypanosoma theileri]|uniref:Putative p22 protein n=1 Tax=Trypanosoma theileri TaxID=67003 RepID=A0A1X0P207_9TRYP|nr:putative p22 protein precursor [Trypanosoma theileri]ORC90974.1 putative p22 protein precursor [Trypanosoma theileri]
MRRTFVSTVLRAVPKAPLLHRSFPSAAAVSVPLFAGIQQRSATFAALADATRREMEDEQQRTTSKEKPKMPEGWKLDRKPGERIFTMHKTFEDEEILLRYRDEVNLEDDRKKYDFTVFITSKGKTLEFEMSFDDEEVVLDRIRFLPDSALALDTSADALSRRSLLYSGPDVRELDDGLVDAFVSYLEDRGVDDELGEFVEAYAVWAEQAEYEAWLSGIHKFVS